jgi:hypothetical protein
METSKIISVESTSAEMFSRPATLLFVEVKTLTGKKLVPKISDPALPKGLFTKENIPAQILDVLIRA